MKKSGTQLNKAEKVGLKVLQTLASDTSVDPGIRLNAAASILHHVEAKNRVTTTTSPN